MTADQQAIFNYTLEHFKEIARQDRFPENYAVEHDTSRCAIGHPELVPLDPFDIYLEVAAESIKVRRPRLDQDLLDTINEDLALQELPPVTMEALLEAEPEAEGYWRDWAREALDTALQLLSMHSKGSLEFDLDEAEEEGKADLIEEKVRDIVDCQRKAAQG